MELWCIRVPEYARNDEDDDDDDGNDDASRLETKNSVSRLDDGSAGNNEGTSFYAGPPKFASFPSLMQTECLIFSSAAGRSSQRVSRETADHDVTRHTYPECAREIAPVGRSAAVLRGTWSFREDEATDGGKSSMSSRSEEVASKSDVSCKDTKVTSEAICEALQGLDCCETECLAETGERRGDYLGHRDSDHREWSEDFQEDETDYQERDHVEEGGEKASARCESPLSSGGSDREDQDAVNTTDPLLAHELHILPGRFDLRPRTERLLKRRSVAKARRYLRETKVRISQSVKQVSDGDVDRDSIICMLALQALCEQVTLTTADTNTGTDARTFVNMAIIWAMVDLQILDPNNLDKQERVMFVELGLFAAQSRSREVVETVGTSKLRRALFEAHRSEFDLCISTQPSCRLPWTPVNPAYHRSVVKSYPNVRERINERLPDESEYAKSTYIPDLTCYHIKETSGESYAARKRKSKILPERNGIDRNIDELLIRLLSFNS